MVYRYPPQVDQAFNAIEVSKGNIVGDTSLSIIGSSQVVGVASFITLSSNASPKVIAVAAETLVLESDSGDDTASGTGAQTFLVTTLDANFNRVTQTVIADGTTPKELTGTHMRTEKVVNITSGSNNVNVGTVLLRKQGGGEIYETVTVGKGISETSSFTVPAGVTARILSIHVFASKGNDAEVQSRITSANGTITISPSVSTYQNSINLALLAPEPLPELTTIEIQAKSRNTNSTITTLIEYLETKNKEI